MSVRTRLLLLFFAITAGAVIFIYLYIVPQLSTRLTNERIAGLERSGQTYTPAITEAIGSGSSQGRLRRLVRDIAQRSNARVTVLGLTGENDTAVSGFVIADSDVELTALRPTYPAVREVLGGEGNTGIERIDNQRLAQAAFAGPGSVGGRPEYVTVLSGPLVDVDGNVALIRRQIVISGTLAIIAALAAGWFAARAHSRRLRRLEAAAEKVAQGDFRNPIPVDSGDEVGQLAMTFNEMQKRLARLDNARREFIANASHELRTPIFSLGGFVELLEEEEQDPDPVARAEFVRTMRAQIERLTKLTTDLLDLSKLDSDALQVRRIAIHINELGELAAREFKPAVERHGSRIDTGELEDVGRAFGDPDRITQILRVLIRNALAHSPEAITITLRAERGDGFVELVVADDGPGIDEADRERVFERFHTGDTTGGSGLGLAIARELAQRMQGEVLLKSLRNPTEFALVLPSA